MVARARQPEIEFDGVPTLLIGTNGQSREVYSLFG